MADEASLTWSSDNATSHNWSASYTLPRSKRPSCRVSSPTATWPLSGKLKRTSNLPTGLQLMKTEYVLPSCTLTIVRMC